jgi:uncharacterized protein
LVLHFALQQQTISAWINEFHYDNSGIDSGEFVEIGHTGGPVTNFRVVLYNGNGGVSYSDITITSTAFNPSGTSYTFIDYPSNGIQNGASTDTGTDPDGIALVDPAGIVVDFISYEGSFTATNGPAVRQSSFDIGIREIGSTASGLSLQKCPNVAKTWFGPSASTKGQANAPNAICAVGAPVTPPTSTPPSIVRIHTIQGNGAPIAVPFSVDVSAIVTSLFTTADVLSGFWMQEEDADSDGNPLTSEGIFVNCGSRCPAGVRVGDLVVVTGMAGESFTTTQIDATVSNGVVTILSSGNPIPTPVSLSLPAAGSTRAFSTFANVEGMLVSFVNPLVVSEYFDLARFGQIVLTESARPYQFTSLNIPSISGFGAANAALATRRIILDDDNDDQNDAITGTSDEAYFYPLGGLSLTNKFRGGDTLPNLRGVLQYAFGAWRVRPVPQVFNYQFAQVNPPPLVPANVGGTLRITSFNVLNYFTTLDTGGTGCGPSGTVECRGANSLEELVRQRDKIVIAITALNPDIAGLIELQNSASNFPISSLVAALNAVVGPGTYAFIPTGLVGGDAIQVGLIYKPSVVVPVNAFKILNSSVDPTFIDTLNRPVLIQTFEELNTFARFTVSVCHLKSKGSACSGDSDVLDGQGNCPQTRRTAALALGNYLATDPTGSNDPDHLILGDLNSYSREDPITTLEQVFGFTNLASAFIGPAAYSYVFDGQLGSLDHALASPTLFPQVTGVTDWHINADEIPLFDYNDAVLNAGESSFERKSSVGSLYAPDPFRSSDHDPVLVGLDLSPPTQSPSSSPMASPSSSPTESPSESPVHAPSSAPSESPVHAPSSAPSESPVHAPSSAPSESPLHAPSSAPSEAPTTAPSESPTDEPTSFPSESPLIDCTIMFDLYNSVTNALVAPLTNGTIIAIPPPCGKTNIEAIIPCGVVSNQVIFELWRGSRRVVRKTENVLPYFLFGNNGRDVKNGKIAAGSYGIRVIADGKTSPFTNFTLRGTCS